MAEEHLDWDVDLPCIGPEDTFCFDCGPGQPCFNRCCAQLNLPLTPYDIVALSIGTGMAATDFLKTYTVTSSGDPTGIPAFYLRMIESPDAPCPFVTPAGCSVYAHRPGACRAYPLGRGTQMGNHGVVERFFLVREEHCLGFDGGSERTAAQWVASEGMEKYNYFNDRFMRLQTMIRATGHPLDGRMRGLAILALWHWDEFDKFVKQVNLADHVEGPLLDNYVRATADAIPEFTLDLGLGWVELATFGQAEGLSRRPRSG